MEDQINTIGSILLGAFYVIGYVLDRRAKQSSQPDEQADPVADEQSAFLSSLSSTASQSTSLNIQLWYKVEDLEAQQIDNLKQIEQLQSANEQKDQQIAQLETQIKGISAENTRLLQQLETL